MIEEMRAGRERERSMVIRRLREALVDLLPEGTSVWIYGSSVSPGRFHEGSDIDLAVEDPMSGIDLWKLLNELTRRTGRSMDICRIEETRLAEMIRRTGERWTV